jgi:uncharacterized protein YigE (DUF2233 family)
MLRTFVVLSVVCVSTAGCRPEGAGPRPVPTDAAVGIGDARHPDDGTRAEVAGEVFAVRRWSFETSRSEVALVDLSMHGSLTEALGADGRVAVNGGFFDPEGRPIGLAASGGRTLSKFSPTMSGGVFYVADGVARIAATEDFDPHMAVAFAVQCRPRLVVAGRPNVKRDDGQRAERTALCVRDEGRTFDVVIAEPLGGARGPSLFALSQYLSAEGRCVDALNLDGGPSTGVAYRPEGRSGAPRAIPPMGPLRHAIVVR